MGFIVELARAKKRIKELEAKVSELQDDIDDLLEHVTLGVDKPSPADIVKETAISVVDSRITIDVSRLNIPFTKPPQVLPIMMIPDTNSMDGLFDFGNNNLYIKPADEENHKIMVDWIAKQWLDSKGLQTVDAVYRIMANEADDPSDFTKPWRWYAIHRLIEVGQDEKGRFFWFAGINNPERDKYPARDKNILWLNTGVVY